MGMIREKIARLRRSDDGGIAVLTALSLPVLVLLVGGALDYSNATRNQYKLQTIADAALLATLSHRQQMNYQVSPSDLMQIFKTEVSKRFSRRFTATEATLDKIEFTTDNQAVRAAVKAKIYNRFLRIVGMKSYDISVLAEARSSTARTEVALVLDITGSMRGGKIRELKKAVASFLNTIYTKMQNAPEENFKVAVVPFSKYVNIGTDKRNESWLQVYEDGWRGWRRRSRIYVEWEGCVGSREYPYNIRDDGYGVNPVQAVMNYRRNPNHSADSRDGWWSNDVYVGPNYRAVQRCQQNPIIPLRSVKTYKDQIISAVNSFDAYGWTYIPAGLVWGWRVLSPEAPYTEGANDQDTNKYNVQKIIVLMTDGANTVAPYRDSSFAYHDHGSADSSYANRMTRELCDNIKAINPATGKRNTEIITITFDVRASSIKRLMNDCASLGSFDVKKGDLAKVFDDIAEKLVDLHLSM